MYEEQVSYLLNKSQKVLTKKYRHFDSNLTEDTARDFIKDVVMNPNKVKKYGFYPFITYKQTRIKYHRTKGKLRAHKKNKTRAISLVAHHDALIYVSYAEKLSKKYEKYLDLNGMSMIPTAYRKKLHYSNINAAKDVFEFIVDSEKCWIIKGDFKGFFDNIRHKILYQNVYKVLNVKKLSSDWEAVLKSLTRYHSVENNQINKAIRRAHMPSYEEGSYIKGHVAMRKLVSSGYLEIVGPNQIGIPQGTSLSAILANVYMIQFDKIIKDIVGDKKGLYRRYSDDFVIVIPKSYLNETELEYFKKDIYSISKEKTKLAIETDKTKIFSFESSSSKKIELKSSNKSYKYKKDWFDYLGFIFDGDTVMLRDRSIYKFHYKGKRSINLSMRIKADRKKIQSGTVIPSYKKKRYFWYKGRRMYENIHQIPKRNIYRKRILNEKGNMNYNISEYKVASKMYLVSYRPGGKRSMMGYARRAQNILEKNDNKYTVKVYSQILNRIEKNQKYIHTIRQNNIGEGTIKK